MSPQTPPARANQAKTVFLPTPSRGRGSAPSTTASYPAARIAAEREQSISVCLPARECAGTVGQIVAGAHRACSNAGAIDEVVVMSGTARRHRRRRRARRCERFLRGRADALLRARSRQGGRDVARPLRSPGRAICFLDADTEGFSAHFATGLLGPLVCEPGVSFVKAHYRRPLSAGERLRRATQRVGSEGAASGEPFGRVGSERGGGGR